LALEAQDIEIMMGLLTPRTTRADQVRSAPGVSTAEAGRVIALVRNARDAFERWRGEGDAVAVAILTLGSPAWTEEGVADIQAAIKEHTDSGADKSENSAEIKWIASFIHDFAVESFRNGHVNRAAVLFGTLLHLKMEEAESLSGLALCGVRLNRFDDALMLANECLKLPVKHPRAYCIAGFCELERGNRKAAQSLLALGARIARNRPEFAEDLRAAQRVLLVLHFA
jgi:Flp pilus assembly protein TadD